MKLNQDRPLTVSIASRSALKARTMRENFSSSFKRCLMGAKPFVLRDQGDAQSAGSLAQTYAQAV
jgi:hypothetical protein